MQHPFVLLFDFDGVLLHSKGPQRIMRQKLQDPRFKWHHLDKYSLTPNDLIRRFEMSSRASNIASIKAMYHNFKEILPHPFQRWRFFFQVGKSKQKFEWQYSSLFTGVFQMLEDLSKKGIIMGIITNSEKKRLEKWLKRTQISHFFSVVITRDDRKRFLVKPDPRPILGALLILKKKFKWNSIDRRIIAFVGDNVSDIRAAKNANIKSVGVLTGHGKIEALKAENPSLLLNSVCELPQNLNLLF
ncbi:HAD family hydrolase [Candidatus Harpocratesius sp.]